MPCGQMVARNMSPEGAHSLTVPEHPRLGARASRPQHAREGRGLRTSHPGANHPLRPGVPRSGAVRRCARPEEVAETVLAGEVIEDYPDDKYGPSCLLFGHTAKQRVLHVQCTHPSRPLLKIITAYEPDPAEWDETLKLRKPK